MSESDSVVQELQALSKTEQKQIGTVQALPSKQTQVENATAQKQLNHDMVQPLNTGEVSAADQAAQTLREYAMEPIAREQIADRDRSITEGISDAVLAVQRFFVGGAADLQGYVTRMSLQDEAEDLGTPQEEYLKAGSHYQGLIRAQKATKSKEERAREIADRQVENYKRLGRIDTAYESLMNERSFPLRLREAGAEAEINQAKAKRKEAIEAKQKAGTWTTSDAVGEVAKEFADTVDAYTDRPSLIVDAAMEQVGDLLIGAGTGKAVSMLARNADDAVRMATMAGASTAVAQEALSNSREVLSEIMDTTKYPDSALESSSPAYVDMLKQGLSPQQARIHLAQQAYDATFLLSGVLAGVSSKLTGADKLAGTLFLPGSTLGKRFARGITPQAVKGTVVEGVEEVVQSGGGSLSQNIAKQQTVDEEQDLTEDVGKSAAIGGLAGAATGGAVSSAKGAAETAQDIKKVAKETIDKVPTIEPEVAKRDEQVDTLAQSEDAIERAYNQFTEASDETLVGNSSVVKDTLIAMRQRQNDANTSPEEAAKLNEQIEGMKTRLREALTKVQTEPKNDQEAMGQIINVDGSVNEEVTTRLAGSKDLTTAQKKLVDELTKPESPVRKMLQKTSDQVAEEIVEGGEGFTGIREYVELTNLSIQEGKADDAAFLLRRLNNFRQSQNRKAKTGKFANGNKIPQRLLPQVRDEAKAIQLVHDSLRDTIIKNFPEVGEASKSTTSRAKDILDESRTPVTQKSITVPARQRQGIVREALGSILSGSTSGEGIGALQTKLRKAGINQSQIKGIQNALETLAIRDEKRLSDITPEERTQLNQAEELVSDTYNQLVDALGSRDELVNVLEQYGDAETVTTIRNQLSALDEPTDLTTDIQLTEGHIAEPTIRDVSEDTPTKYKELVQQIEDKITTDPSILDDANIGDAFNGLRDSVGVFDDDAVDVFNQAVNLFNTLGINNAQVRAANSETKAISTTPQNRTVINSIESAGSTVKTSFRYVGRKLGLLHTENDLVQKLSDKDSETYDYLTQNLSTNDINDLDAYMQFARIFTKNVNKVVTGKKDERNQINYILSDFIKDGEFDPTIALAVATGFSNWATGYARKSLYNDNEAIGKFLGKQNTDGYQPNKEERKLREAGVNSNFMAEQVGRNIIGTLGLALRESANEDYLKQLSINLGALAISAANEAGMVDVTYAQIKYNESGDVTAVTMVDKPKGAGAIQGVRVRPNKSQPTDGPTRLASRVEDAMRGNQNTYLMRDVLGVESSYMPVFMDGESMPEPKVNVSPKQAAAITKNQEIPYVLDTEMWDIANKLSPAHREGLVDGVPPEGTEHQNNTSRNQAMRDSVLTELSNVETIIQQMKDTGSKTIRFAISVGSNKRMMQQGTLGNPQNSKLVRHLFKMEKAKVEVKPDDADMQLAYKLAVMEALDIDSTSGRGVDKSVDKAVTDAFEMLFTDESFADLRAAVEAIQTDSNIKAVEDYLGVPVKRGSGTAGTAAKLDGLIALSKYKKDEPFTANIFKENDGITNGIAIALLQLAGADNYLDYVARLARTGIYVDVGEGTLNSFGEFAALQNQDSYEVFGTAMREELNKPLAQKEVIGVNPKNNISKLRFLPTLEGFSFNKGKLELDSDVIYNRMSGAINYFMSKSVIGKDGNPITLKETVDDISRDFAKNPLMIANYGAGIKGLKVALANNIVRSIELALEDIAVTTDPVAKRAAIETLERAVNTLSPFPQFTEFKDGKPVVDSEYSFKVANNPLETEVGNQVYNNAALAVEFTYGPAMDATFQNLFGVQKEKVDKIVGVSRLATGLYDLVQDKLVSAKKKETDKAYLTVGERNEINDSLKEYAPMVATAMSEDRLVDGIWVPKGEKTKDVDNTGKALDSGSEVKVSLPFAGVQSSTFKTYSSKVQDPGVSLAAKLVQSIDASTQAASMTQTDLVNIHDASIFSLEDMVQGTVKQNDGFMQIHKDYSMFDAVLEMLDGVMSHPDLTDKDVATVIDALGLEEVIPSIESLREDAKVINNNRKMVTEQATVNVNQYSGGDTTGATFTPNEKQGTWDGVVEEVEPEVTSTGTEALLEATKSSDDLRKYMKDYYGSEVQSKIIDKIFDSLNQRTPKFTVFASQEQLNQDKDAKRNATQFDGMYYPNTHEVHIYSPARNPELTEDQLMDTILHELDHAAITAGMEKDFKKGKPQTQEAKDMVQIFNMLKKTKKAVEILGETNHKYIFQDQTSMVRGIGEMLAFAKANANFRNYLQGVKLGKSKNSLFDRMLAAAVAFLGIAKDVASLYEAMIGLSARWYGVQHAPIQMQEVSLVSDWADSIQTKGNYGQVTKDTAKLLVKRLRSGMTYEEARQSMIDSLARYKGDTRKAYVRAQATVFRNTDKLMVQINKPGEGMGMPRSEDTRSFTEATELNKGNLRDVFDRLVGIGSVQASQEHSGHLSKMLDVIEPTFKNMMFKAHYGSEETYGKVTDAGIELTINTAAKANNIEMSAQEGLVHELMHTFFQGVDKKSWAYREIKKEYRTARKNLKPEDFLTGIKNPTAKDVLAAKRRYDHTIHNRVEGGTEYKTELGITKTWFNADPVEEFAVMALTNEPLRAALANMNERVNTEPKTFLDKMINLYRVLLNTLEDTIDLKGIDGDARMVRLAEHLMGSVNQKRSLVYRSVAVLDDRLDTTSEWMKDIFAKSTLGKVVTGLPSIKDYAEQAGVSQYAKDLTNQFADTALAKNKLLNGIYNEFTTGRRSLSELARLISKSSQLIEKRTQQLREYVARDINEYMPELTPEQSAELYTSILETDAQSLLAQHSTAEAMELMKDSGKRKRRLQALVKALRASAPTASRYMRHHAEDLGYHMVTGERLLLDGKYTNAMQVANMWGYDGKYGTVNVDTTTEIVEEMATLFALEYAEPNLIGIKPEGIELLLTLSKETVDASKQTTFADNLFNLRKGYVKETFENQVDITVAPASEEARLVSLGYVKGDVVQQDTLAQEEKQFYFTKEDSNVARYLTGALSTASPARRGTDLFKISESDSEIQRLRIATKEAQLMKDKQKVSRSTFAGKPIKVSPEKRSTVAQPVFDANGKITGYRYVASNYTKDNLRGRNKDVANALGSTLAGISRRLGTDEVNTELMEYFHQTFVDEYDSTPNLFIDISKDPDYKEQYALIPPAAKAKAEELFGSKSIWVKRNQAEIALGYRKFSVSQLQIDKSPKATATREILRLTNNMATTMFNNQVGIAVEDYWQGFVSTAKDTLVIKSGFVTGANILSNMAQLWMAGVNPAQSVKDHAEAYAATQQYLKDQEREFRINLEMKRPGVTANETKALASELAVVRQDLYNNPVRELMEAGLFSTIVEDVEVGENVSQVRDKIDELIEPIANRTPDVIKNAAKTMLLTHDTKAYRVMRDIAQISDFAAKYSLHKHNLSEGMSLNDSIRVVRSEFVDYDIPQTKALQYVNDMGLMGFTKYFFRIQQVIARRFADRPARMMSFVLLQSLLGIGIYSPLDAAFGLDGLSHRFYGPSDWADFATQSAPMNLLVH